jgi:cyclopropane-fatty-acyl-phospholipid synthase
MFSWWSSDAKRLRAMRNMAEHLAPLLDLPVSLRLWDDSEASLGSRPDNPFVLALSSPGVISSLLRRPTLANVIEHYLAGRLDPQGGDLIALGSAVRSSRSRGSIRGVRRWYLLRQLWPFLLYPADRSPVEHCIPDADIGLQQQPQRNRKEFIEFHYDLSTEFYQLFLDSELVYSCGYFTDWNNSLEQAQQDKLEHICRKLRFQSGERFLDVGCGWGGLLCHAARKYGVRAHGLTLSKEQFAYTAEKIKRLGLGEQVTVELADYHDHQGTYDKIASVGMVEHVGIANYPTYFHKLGSLLRDRGLLLNHGITRPAKSSAAKFRKMRPEYRVIQKYIFPGAELDHIGRSLEVMEACRFEVHDVEGWRGHYARTLRHWCQRLSANREQAVRLVGEQKYRAWVAYLAVCSFAFEDGMLRVFQTVATRHAKKGFSEMPPTRAHVYRTESAALKQVV